jgi:hypothetical protein
MLSAVLASSSADAGSKRGGRVTVTGCPQPGVTGNCLMLRAKDGTLYNITGASPRPRPARRMIRVRGTVADKASICGQGIVLDRIRWTRTRQRCPK